MPRRTAAPLAACGLDFASLVRQHQAMVFSIAWHLLRDRAVAEELAQDVFLSLHQHLAEMESPEHALYWLRRVTTNRALDEARRRQRRPMVSLESAPEPVAVTATGDPMLGRALTKLVAALPEKSRAIVVLRYQEDLDPTEIARVLAIPVGTVKSQLQRALALLREKLTRVAGQAPGLSLGKE
jgi:RNA polymerase sigma-70 factor, ECF subfamily